MDKKIATISGDGIGAEIMSSAKAVLSKICAQYNHNFIFTEAPMGGIAIDTFGEPLPLSSIKTCKSSDAVLLSAVGGAKWDNNPPHLRPEKGLLEIRKALNLYANIRPAKLFNSLNDRSPLAPERIKNGIDMIIVRELTGGIYFGDKGTRRGDFGREAYDTEVYSEIEIERIARVAFELALTRSKILTSIDKANVLETSRLWRKVIHEVGQDYPNVTIKDVLVDNATMQFIKDPSQFDIIVTNNMFGDILSDLSAMMTGSIGLLPSASIGDTTFGMYEPIHGSAPDIAGQNIANPIAMILSSAMMLRTSFDMQKEATSIENAVELTLRQGYRTKDIAKHTDNYLSTTEITEKIISNLC